MGPLRPRRPEVSQFLRFYLENVDKFAVEGGYDAPLAHDKETNQEALTRLDDAKTSEAPVSK